MSLIARCTWDAVSEVDGYNVYLDSGSGYVKQNTSLITGTHMIYQGFQMVLIQLMLQVF